jgi:hypothetical protein
MTGILFFCFFMVASRCQKERDKFKLKILKGGLVYEENYFDNRGLFPLVYAYADFLQDGLSG